MAYMRGEYYIYRDAEGIQVYGPDGELFLPQDIADALVVMRYAQLAQEPGLVHRIEQATAGAYAGNFGVDALRAKLGLPLAMQAVVDLVEQLGEEAPD